MITLLTGEIGCGKTTLCQRLAEAGCAQGLRVAGIITLPGAGGKDELWALDLAGGERRFLARRTFHQDGRLGRYCFDADTFAWAAAAVRRTLARAELLIIDEIGPLELRQSQGFAPLLDDLARASCPVVLTVRRTQCKALERRLGQPVRVVPISSGLQACPQLAGVHMNSQAFAFFNFQG